MMVDLNDSFLEFSKCTGIPVQGDRNGQIVSITTLKKKDVPELENPDEPPQTVGSPKQQNNSHNRYDRESDYNGEESSYLVNHQSPMEQSRVAIPLDTGILRTSNKQYVQLKPRKLTRFRYIVFLQCINDIPIRQMRTHPQETYWVEIEVLDQVLRYKVDPQYLQVQPESEGFCRIDMNRLSIKHFFSNGRDGLRNYVQEAKVDIF